MANSSYVLLEIQAESREPVELSTARRLSPFAIVWVAAGCLVLPFHLNAVGLDDTPGQRPITWTQGFTAAIANTLGPWAGHAVRAVDFPNAGLRSFRLFPALALTACFFALVGCGLASRQAFGRRSAVTLFGVFMVVWYGYGFVLITDGLL